MRSEQEVINQILDFTRREKPVRVVMQNGSRVNTNAPEDAWQDYDIVFFIRDLPAAGYRKEQQWIGQFGELVIMQNLDPERGYPLGYQFLMQFRDGVRIDLSFRDIKDIEIEARDDSLSKILLDKDDLAPELPPPNDAKYHTAKPQEQEFAELLNEAWWIQPYIAKGLLRRELPYAKYMFDVVLMDCIRKLLCWQIGLDNGWQVNPGCHEKWFQRFLPPELYDQFVSVFPGTDYSEIWNALFRAGALISKIGQHLAQHLSYDYNSREDINTQEFLQNMFKP
jgi:aminoglycoside 6-adenylyltransferase